ncbi:MAG: integrin alpha [Planctomycetota bacterium]
MTVTDDGDERMFGHALALVGDVDGDGLADWLVGAPTGVRACQAGRAELRAGRDGSRIAVLEEPVASFGVAVTGLGDVDGDGCADFAVGASPIALNATGQGHVTIFSGRDRRVVRTLRNDIPGYWYGGTIADAGDTDLDGAHDLLVGGNFGHAPGMVRLYSGRTGALLQTFRDDDPASGFGTCVAGIGDIDGDGAADIAIGAPHAPDSPGPDQVLVFSGRTGARRLHLAREASNFGCCIARYDAGGSPLLAIGSTHGGNSACGVIDLVGLDGNGVCTVYGPSANSWFGGAFAATDDLDGDGRPEFFVAGPRGGHEGVVALVHSGELQFVR